MSTHVEPRLAVERAFAFLEDRVLREQCCSSLPLPVCSREICDNPSGGLLEFRRKVKNLFLKLRFVANVVKYLPGQGVQHPETQVNYLSGLEQGGPARART